MFLLLKSSTLEHNVEKRISWNICTIGRGVRNISIKKWEIYYFKNKIILFIINFRRNHAICSGQVQSKKEGKDQESIKSSTTPDLGYQWESDTSQLDITNESQEVSHFPAGDYKGSTNRCAWKHNKNKTEIT